MRSPIFIIGYGRSGTHWLAQTLERHKDIRATIEIQPIFSIVTEMALNPKLQNRLFWRLVLQYKWQILKSKPKRYLDKSHPNIWIAEKLSNAFSKAQFLGIERNPYATVSSAIKHKGGEAIRNHWRELPIPNNFLGIDKSMAEVYDSLPLSKKYALSWVSHHQRMNDLENILGDRLKVVKYEELVHHTATIIDELKEFLKLSTPISILKVQKESLTKWESNLTKDQLLEIESIVGFPPSKLK